MRRLRTVALLLALAACSSSHSKFDPTHAGQASAPPTTVPAPVAGSFTIGAVDLQAVHADAALPDPVRAGVKALLDRYLNTAVVLPLHTGQPAGDLGAIFAGPALERAAGPDRAALVDEGLPPAAPVRVGTAQADLTALVGPDGVAVLTAAVKVVVTGEADGAPLTVERSGELLLADAGNDNNWHVTGYDLTVTRNSAGAVTTTTVRR